MTKINVKFPMTINMDWLEELAKKNPNVKGIDKYYDVQASISVPLDYIPRKGETVVLDDKFLGFKALSPLYLNVMEVSHIPGHKENEVEILCRMVYHNVDARKYLRLFTHFLDEDADEFKVVMPNSFTQWRNDLDAMEHTLEYSQRTLEDLKLRRCFKRKEGN